MSFNGFVNAILLKIFFQKYFLYGWIFICWIIKQNKKYMLTNILFNAGAKVEY